MALTPRQRKFVAAYSGNATEAARLAGYTGNEESLGKQGYRLSKNVQIAAAIAAREVPVIAGLVATREERNAFRTAAMRDTEHDINARLKAAEQLGKAEGDFVEKHEHEHVVTIRVVDPYAVKP